MEAFDAADLELLTDEQWWTSALLFEIWFDFQNQNSLQLFEETLLCDRLVFGRWNPGKRDCSSLKSIHSRWILKSKKWNYPVGFRSYIYAEQNPSELFNYPQARLFTYPPQISRLCGNFYSGIQLG